MALSHLAVGRFEVCVAAGAGSCGVRRRLALSCTVPACSLASGSKLEACKTGFRVCVLSQWIVEKLKYMPASIQSPESDAVFQWIVGQGHRAATRARKIVCVFICVETGACVSRVFGYRILFSCRVSVPHGTPAPERSDTMAGLCSTHVASSSLVASAHAPLSRAQRLHSTALGANSSTRANPQARAAVPRALYLADTVPT